MSKVPLVYPVFFKTYIDKVFDVNLKDNLLYSLKEFEKVSFSIPESKYNYAYAEGKWTIKELISHLIDTERILTYRALCISRLETVNLPSFDERKYVENSNANDIPFIDLISEFILVRKSTIAMFSSFNDEILIRQGKVSNEIISVNALGFIISGHVLHHLNILEERYL